MIVRVILTLIVSVTYDIVPFMYSSYDDKFVFLTAIAVVLLAILEPVVYITTKKNKILILTTLLSNDSDRNTKEVLNSIDDCILVIQEGSNNILLKNKAAHELLSFERFEPLGLTPLESKEFRPLTTS